MLMVCSLSKLSPVLLTPTKTASLYGLCCYNYRLLKVSHSFQNYYIFLKASQHYQCGAELEYPWDWQPPRHCQKCSLLWGPSDDLVDGIVNKSHETSCHGNSLNANFEKLSTRGLRILGNNLKAMDISLLLPGKSGLCEEEWMMWKSEMKENLKKDEDRYVAWIRVSPVFQ